MFTVQALHGNVLKWFKAAFCHSNPILRKVSCRFSRCFLICSWVDRGTFVKVQLWPVCLQVYHQGLQAEESIINFTYQTVEDSNSRVRQTSCTWRKGIQWARLINRKHSWPNLFQTNKPSVHLLRGVKVLLVKLGHSGAISAKLQKPRKDRRQMNRDMVKTGL